MLSADLEGGGPPLSCFEHQIPITGGLARVFSNGVDWAADGIDSKACEPVTYTECYQSHAHKGDDPLTLQLYFSPCLTPTGINYWSDTYLRKNNCSKQDNVSFHFSVFRSFLPMFPSCTKTFTYSPFIASLNSSTSLSLFFFYLWL